MERIEEIAEKIFDICYDVDKNITGLPEEDSRIWAKANSIRHAHTIMAMLDFIKKRNKNKIKILNASGIACGHQDFSILHYFRTHTKIVLDWVVFDTPVNEHLEKVLFKKYQTDLKIELNLSDFTRVDRDGLFGPVKKAYDIVLFTEIAEHLDHTAFLNTLSAVRKRMTDDGILIITTPNLVSLPNRFRILRGNTDGMYNGDGTLNGERGTFGHITLYDPGRLTRILEDVGFNVDLQYTFTFGHGPKEKEWGKRVIIKLNDFLSYFFKNSRINIFIVASKGDVKKIPLEH